MMTEALDGDALASASSRRRDVAAEIVGAVARSRRWLAVGLERRAGELRHGKSMPPLIEVRSAKARGRLDDLGPEKSLAVASSRMTVQSMTDLLRPDARPLHEAGPRSGQRSGERIAW